MKKMSKKKCFVNGASFTIKNCGIQLEDLITTAIGKNKNQLSLAVAVNNELVQKSKWNYGDASFKFPQYSSTIDQ